ncbi:outer membrane lipoprotein carrier protein LolA [Caballeronia sp. LZ001]|uniref:LolA family protein n=1 Tax=Caballeronia sp. LZ001 TaxID=3038553 RepID=UPI00285D5E7C|nr:outer membrane lipoprotein carrier protein LolA [Caballeronia sp. LZ001]MDR5801396.1 outer membrane lipoprotein carrier protein LolA [Caballeronia sp. LZ001]
MVTFSLSRRRAIFSALLVFTMQSVQALAATGSDALVREIATRLAKTDALRARFTQTRTLAAMKAPLVSRGDLLMMRESGIVWRIREPYQTTFVLDETGVTELDANGARAGRRKNGMRASAGASQASAMVRAILAGDLSSLYSQFDIQASGTPDRWTMSLTPNQPQLLQMIANVRVEGGAFLSNVLITSPNGDTTCFEFGAVTPLTRFSEAERALFEAVR